MTDERPLVWLPFDPDLLDPPPEGARYEQVVPREDDLPESASDVRFYVPSYSVSARQGPLLEQMPRLEVVQTLTAGVDHIRSAIPEGVLLCNGRGIHNTSTAELAMTLTLATLRGVPGFVDAQHAGKWTQGWRESLADKRVMILGYGDIGRDLERRLEPFEVEVVRVARTARDGDEGRRVHAQDDVPDLLPEVDVVILVVPATDDTRGMVDAAFLGRMQQGALLVNVARGAVVVTADLIEACTAGRVRAALDVTDPEPLPPDHPLWSTPNVLVTPHVGGATPAMWPRAYALIREQVRRFAAGEDLENVMTGDY